uniref:SAP domain-containing protein n=1 Tax=Macrostomum lignano TaxID=282301 RepID=A0A1I8IR52_9PLAT
MKVADLRRELESRGRDSRGLKAQLVARLEEVLREEAEAKEAKPDVEMKEADPEKPGDAAAETSENDDAKESGEKPRVSPLSDREQDRIRRHHRLPDTPALPAWPSRTAKGGRLRLESASLSQLLSNRLDSGGRESAFEVALFCEQFHEMLVRDCAYNICTALADCEQNEGEAGTTGAATSADDGSETQRKRPRLDSSAAADAGADEAATGLTRTIRPALLQACEFFDRDRTGQLASRDIEELVLSLGLLHSRSQIRRWVDKASGTEGASSLRYRRLTDRAVTAAEADAGYTAESAAQESGDSRPAPACSSEPVAARRFRPTAAAARPGCGCGCCDRPRPPWLPRGYAEYRQLLRDALDAVNAARQPFVDLFEAERLAIEEARKQREAEAAAAEAAKAAAAEAEKAAAAEAGDGEADNSDSVKPDEAEISEVEGGKEWAVVDAV